MLGMNKPVVRVGWIARVGCSVLAAVATCGASAHGAPDAPPVLTVHADKAVHEVSPRLWGVFFEEINHAGDGGIYAELVRNRCFEEPPTAGEATPGWSLRASAHGAGAMVVDRAEKIGATTGNSLRVVVKKGPVSVVNSGYWGIGVRKGGHRLRLDIKADEPLRKDVKITLESVEGVTLAEAVLGDLREGWQRLGLGLSASAESANARLVITFKGEGTAWLDTVSLEHEETWAGRRHGVRKDLGTLVENLRPAFLRFPGGCYVEGGDRLEDAFRWKTTIADIGERPGHANANWGYWSSDGLGYHEYLQWCEDLRAEPMFVVNCGMSHKEVVPLGELGVWVQDVLDAIEYANGATTTPWGARRAANGHPGSFGLKYIEIGNENGMFGSFGGTREQYTERYKLFYDAIKAKHPEIVTISNTRVNAPMELVDDHFYNSPSWFWGNTRMYDGAGRDGPKIYVGEYAVTQGCGEGNLAAALGEAAFMTGLERNSDVVVMASYAPMFVHARDRKWNPNMVVFDGVRSFGTPSYHVQQMFAANRPDTVLAADVPEVVTPLEVTRGGIGLGTWRTTAEFRDVVVERDGKVVYSSEFAGGAKGWKPGAGEWKAEGGVYRQSAGGEKMFALLDLPALRDASDYTVTLKARKLGGDEGFLVLFRAPDADHYSWWNIGGWGNREHAIERSVGGSKGGIGPHVQGAVEVGRWYDVKVELAGARIRCWLDGKLVHEVEEKPAPAFAAVAGRVEETGEIVLKVVNGGERAVAVRLVFPGVTLEGRGKATVLSSASLADENSFDEPDKIMPVESDVTISPAEGGFVHEFPARSLSVLRLGVRK
jgi:alpha-L-arabinofuranosidase